MIEYNFPAMLAAINYHDQDGITGGNFFPIAKHSVSRPRLGQRNRAAVNQEKQPNFG